MHAHPSRTWPAPFRLTVSSIALTVALVLVLTPFTAIRAQDPQGSNTNPLAFGPGSSHHRPEQACLGPAQGGRCASGA